MKSLLHNPFFWFGVYYLFSSIVSGMPAPDDKSSNAYRWAYASLHMLAANLFTALKSSGKLPANGDSMKSIIVIFAALLFLAPVVSQGQAPAPSPSPTPDESNVGVHFVTDSAFYQLSDGKQATVFTARLPVTPRYSGIFSEWLVPTAKGNISLAGVEFREKLGHLIKGYSNNLDLNMLELFARGQLGSELNAVDSSKKFAYGIEGGLEFPVGSIAGGTVKTGVRIGFLGVPGAHEKFQLGSQATISPQVSVSF